MQKPNYQGLFAFYYLKSMHSKAFGYHTLFTRFTDYPQ